METTNVDCVVRNPTEGFGACALNRLPVLTNAIVREHLIHLLYTLGEPNVPWLIPLWDAYIAMSFPFFTFRNQLFPNWKKH
jgi:hypothetical protein